MNAEIWTVCNACNKRVTEDSIHTCSPQVKQLSDEEIDKLVKMLWYQAEYSKSKEDFLIDARAIIKEITE